MGSNNMTWAGMTMAVILAGCSVGGPRQSPLIGATAGSPTVADVYHGRIGQAPQPSRPDPRTLLAEHGGARAIGAGDELTRRYWSALEPMNQRFQRVPNPDLLMVVYPHMAKGKYPVPGYVTTFPMFDEVHYALPGETSNDLARMRSFHMPAPADGKPTGRE